MHPRLRDRPLLRRLPTALGLRLLLGGLYLRLGLRYLQLVGRLVLRRLLVRVVAAGRLARASSRGAGGRVLATAAAFALAAPWVGLQLGLPPVPDLVLADASTAAAEPRGAAWSAPMDGSLRVTRPFTPPATHYSAGHRGVDLAAPPGTAVLAAGAGTVAFAGSVAGRGVVSIDHADGLRTTYEPVDAIAVRRGDSVTPGRSLGRLAAGHDGCLAPSCLHWGLRRGSGSTAVYLDPMLLLGLGPVRLLPLDHGPTGSRIGGMAVVRWSLSVDPDLDERVREQVAATGLTLSAWVAQTLDTQLKLNGMREVLDEYALEFAPPSEREMARARRRLRGEGDR